MLVGRPGELLTKEELLASVWDGSFVEESNLTVAISTLRHALDEDPHERRYIQTVARRGYRFIADVRELQRPSVTPSDVPAMTTVEPVERAATGAHLPMPEEQVPATAATPDPARMRLWPMALVAGVLLAALITGSWYLLRPTDPIHSLAVLPFIGVSGGAGSGSPENQVILLGITDGLISRLDPELVVRPTSAVLRYSAFPGAGSGLVDPLVAGREQGVDAVLSGSMESTSDRTTLKLRLTRVHDGLTLWQDSEGKPDGLSQLEQHAGGCGSGSAASFRRSGGAEKAGTKRVIESRWSGISTLSEGTVFLESAHG